MTRVTLEKLESCLIMDLEHDFRHKWWCLANLIDSFYDLVHEHDWDKALHVFLFFFFFPRKHLSSPSKTRPIFPWNIHTPMPVSKSSKHDVDLNIMSTESYFSSLRTTLASAARNWTQNFVPSFVISLVIKSLTFRINSNRILSTVQQLTLKNNLYKILKTRIPQPSSR